MYCTAMNANKNVTYKINNREVTFEVTADKIGYGKQENIFLKDDNLIQNAEWFAEGYTVQPFLDNSKYELLYAYIVDLFKTNLAKITNKSLDTFTLEKYHEYVDNKTHLQFLQSVTATSRGAKGIKLETLPFSYRNIDAKISDICKRDISCKNLFTDCFWLRVVRPNAAKDNNPPHKDGYIRRNRKMINIYVGLAGSNELSSLPFVPHSHLLNERYIERSYGQTFINGSKFTNPAVTGLYNRSIEMVTPNPQKNEVLVFTPYMIHGGGKNLNSFQTRISIEMRFKPRRLEKYFGFYND